MITMALWVMEETDRAKILKRTDERIQNFITKLILGTITVLVL